MPQLAQLRDLIERGRTAQLRRYQSVLHWYVKQQDRLYIKHTEGYKNPEGVEIVQPRTAFYETWDGLTEDLSYDVEMSGWYITDDALPDYWQEPANEEPRNFDTFS